MMKLLLFNNEVKRKVIKILSIVFLLAFSSSIWFGCSNEPNVADPPDPVEMTVTVWPEDGATNVARGIKPTYTFSHELNNELPNITVSKQNSGEEIELTVVKVSSTVYRIEFTNLLNELATYDMYLHSAKGKNGEILSGSLPIVTSFTTQEVIIPSLSLSVIFPPNNSEIPDSTSTLHYQANFELNPSTVEPSFTLTNTTTSTQLNPIIDVSGKDIYVNVDGLLEHSSEYTAEFDPDIIRGTNGEKPNSVYSFSFTTEVVIPPPVFTTPDGYLQHTGTYKDGYIYVGGMGPNDEGFTACFNSEGDSVWFHPFKVNENYTRVHGIAVTQDGIYSILEVKPNPDPFVLGEVWLYYQSNNGEYANKWQRTTGSKIKSITSSEIEVYISYIKNNMGYVDRFSTNGLVSSIVHDYSEALYFYNGFLYIAGSSLPDAALFLSKWNSNLSDSIWYREIKHPNVWTNSFINLNFAFDRLHILGFEWANPGGGMLVLQQYNDSGDLLADLNFPSYNGNLHDCSSDFTDLYFISNGGLYQIDYIGNMSQMNSMEGWGVFGLVDAIGSGYKVAVTDNTNILKLFK